MKDVICFVGEHMDSSVKIVRWLRKVGEKVSYNEPLCEVTTDKATVEIASPADGTLISINKAEDQSVEIGSILAVIDDKPLASQIEISNINSTTNVILDGAPKRMSPAVRRLFKERGLSAEQIVGSGRDGLITADDVLNTKAAASSQNLSHFFPHTAMRRTIASRVRQSVLQEAPHITAFFEIDLKNLLIKIEENKRESQLKKGLALTAFFLKSSSLAMLEVPEINSKWLDDGIEVFSEHHIGIVTSLGRNGLVIPVIKNAEKKSIFEINTELEEIKLRRDNGSLKPHEDDIGTFSISNYGSQAGLFVSPIVINQPQSAILGIGQMEYRVRQKKETLVPGQAPLISDFEPRPMVYVSLTIDHRILDAFHTNHFMNKFIKLLETPEVFFVRPNADVDDKVQNAQQ